MHEVIILTDEEFYEKQKKDARSDFLKELEQMSKPTKKQSFSIKELSDTDRTPEKKLSKKEDDDSLSSYMSKSKGMAGLNDEDWGDFVEDLSGFELSPIESVTDENISGFQLDSDIIDPDGNKYDKVFKKELAMLSEVLKDVKAHGTRVNNVLKKMNVGGKGTSSRTTGVPKGYSDLVEIYNGINNTKVQVIKAMTDLKSKQMDWTFKDKANNPQETESVDNIADMYYKKIISGGTKNFIQNSMSAYQHTDFEYDPVTDSQTSDEQETSENLDTTNIDSLVLSTGFNITQPINSQPMSYQQDDILGDEFGYIANENNDYEVCVYQYGDGKYQFGAIDKDGEPLDNIELPSDSNPDIMESLQIRPGSDFIYDKYGRKYRLIEMGSVDISDIDDMEYPYD